MAGQNDDNGKVLVSELGSCSLSSSTSGRPSTTTTDEPVLANATTEQTTKAEKEKQRKQAHEKARKARRKIASEEAMNGSLPSDSNPKPSDSKPVPSTTRPRLKNPEWVKTGRSQARKDLRDGTIDSAHARLQFKILNDEWIPGFGSLVCSMFPDMRDKVLTADVVTAAIKHAIQFGIRNEAKRIAAAQDGYNDTLSRFAKESKPLTRMPADVYASELAFFRRCYPIGSSTEDWHLVVEPTIQEDRVTEFSIRILFTPYLKTNESVEEALYTVAALPLKHGPAAHITLPMFRKAMQDVQRGNENWPISFGHNHVYRAKNAIQLARWAIAFAPTLSAEQKEITLEFAETFWNKSKESFIPGITGKDTDTIDNSYSAGQTQLMKAIVFGTMTLKALGLEFNAKPGPEKDSQPSIEVWDKSQWFGMKLLQS